MTTTDPLAALLHEERINCGIPVAECAVGVHVNDALNLVAAGVTLAPTPPDAPDPDGVACDWDEHGRCRCKPPTPPDALREAVIHAARDVDGLWFPQDDNDTGTDLTFWGPGAGEALRDLRDAVEALYDAEDDAPILTVTTPDGTVYQREHDVQCALAADHSGPCMWVGGRRPEVL